jgi:hypothetical protein
MAARRRRYNTMARAIVSPGAQLRERALDAGDHQGARPHRASERFLASPRRSTPSCPPRRLPSSTSLLRCWLRSCVCARLPRRRARWHCTGGTPRTEPQLHERGWRRLAAPSSRGARLRRGHASRRAAFAPVATSEQPRRHRRVRASLVVQGAHLVGPLLLQVDRAGREPASRGSPCIAINRPTARCQARHRLSRRATPHGLVRAGPPRPRRARRRHRRRTGAGVLLRRFPARREPSDQARQHRRELGVARGQGERAARDAAPRETEVPAMNAAPPCKMPPRKIR